MEPVLVVNKTYKIVLVASETCNLPKPALDVIARTFAQRILRGLPKQANDRLNTTTNVVGRRGNEQQRFAANSFERRKLNREWRQAATSAARCRERRRAVPQKSRGI